MDDGGPAYPGPALRQVHSIEGSPQDDLPGHPGMTMHDYAAVKFVAVVLAGCLSRENVIMGDATDCDKIANVGLNMADAFIAAMERRRKTP